MKTSIIPVQAPAWHIIDAEGQSLGRMAATIATVLRGKHKPTFSPHQLCGDHVVVINISKLKFTVPKLKRKLYYKHTGFIGHLKTKTLEERMEKHPDRVVMDAVKRMLSKTRLRNEMLKRLHLYTDANHNHEAQKPTPLTIS
ncbi:50S ribosomal protein L13 [Candidatus Peregrinibacteria bacterium]|jgi:large subunit ribosomal protein L13|nr:50S ribosomal protein L13 [Candidatus Peregrinibacteria bacterium]MBT3599099.1 50S ribosomal protein L13 [Candidatus Peregrinibacteria bacterium]MBT4367666.1 50S ribosomal protein L13 [Candidatus Peregrinibacteria bacterium]MBT4585444.1 50S ribosomal protein L13 [Candidatus Peregrinibacteria bacterium]MBT6730405.1 50S ribosomal protein L13 [Candidatus Peregrinibacteria bacterium]